MIIISSIWKVDDALAHFKAKHVISINDPGSVPPTLPSIEDANRLSLEFHDVVQNTQGKVLVTPSQIEKMVSFGRKAIGRGDPILIHCTAGVSRSTAAGLVIAASYWTKEMELLGQLLRNKAPFSQPNSLMIQLGDAFLGLNSQLISAVEKLDGPNMELAPEPFVLNVI